MEIDIETRTLVETELRRGTSKSRIANILKVPYEEASELIDQINLDLRPEIGDEIKFFFRDRKMTGEIEKLLTNSAVVRIYWDYSDPEMFEILEEKTIVNFKDIQEFVVIKNKS